MIVILITIFAGVVGALSGGWSAAWFSGTRRTPIADWALGVIGFAGLFYAQLHWMKAPLVLVPLSLKSLLGAILLPVVHQALRSSFSK